MKLHQHFEFGPASQDPFSFCQIQLALETVYAVQNAKTISACIIELNKYISRTRVVVLVRLNIVIIFAVVYPCGLRSKKLKN